MGFAADEIRLPRSAGDNGVGNSFSVEKVDRGHPAWDCARLTIGGQSCEITLDNLDVLVSELIKVFRSPHDIPAGDTQQRDSYLMTVLTPRWAGRFIGLGLPPGRLMVGDVVKRTDLLDRDIALSIGKSAANAIHRAVAEKA